MAPAREAEIDLHGRAAGLHASRDRAASTPPTRSPPRRRAACPRRSRTCRTSRSAPRKAARSAPPSSPGPGQKIISADYSQIELRVLAHMADIPQLRQAFADGIDIHAATASAMFGVPLDRDDAGPPPQRQDDQFRHHLRHLGLRARRAGSASTAARRAPSSSSISSASPASATTWTRPRRSAARTATSRRCSGASATIRDIKISNPSQRAAVERQAINAPIQGTAADIIRRAMIRMEDALAEAEAVRAHAAAGARRARLRGARRRGRGHAAGDPPGHGGGAAPGRAALRCRSRSTPARRGNWDEAH